MTPNLQKQTFTKENILKAPEENGVYIFCANNKPIYIGKSKNLKRRLSSYLNTPLNNKTSKMVKNAQYFSVICVASEIEALLLEAKLVNKYKPKYNIQLKDDKHPLYIKITKEKYPRVITARKKENASEKGDYYGPFPSSRNVKDVLRMLRRVIPYAQHKLGKRACIYSQMGLCNPCPNIIENETHQKIRTVLKNIYTKNIGLIKKFLNGNISLIKKGLEKEMQRYSQNQNYEEANKIKQKLEMINYITQPVTSVSSFLENPNLLEDVRNIELTDLYKFLSKYFTNLSQLERIECYDIAHISGSNPTASMVTFISGSPEKSLYRHFRIRQKKSQSDTDSLREAIKRRIKHLADWGEPDLIVVDGGKGQVSTFIDEIQLLKLCKIGNSSPRRWPNGLLRGESCGQPNIPVVGIAKRLETLVIPISYENSKIKYIEKQLSKGPAKNLIQRLRNEAHRFAQRYHHTLLKKELLKS